MSLAKSYDSRQEIYVRKFLHARGLRFRKNDQRFPGKPDVVLPKYRTIILIHGCFWHGHDCGKRLPKSNAKFWSDKIEKNKARDIATLKKLRSAGWKVFVIWQCEISNIEKRNRRLEKLVKNIRKEIGT